jgi:crotonobetainyl-CoA:carnitine CoA-transferase CaiB-like acyl-CoA transferase
MARRENEDGISPIGPLNNIVVLDLADKQGSFCSKLLADLGATVMKVEGPGGDPSRRCDPNSFFCNNTNKLSVIIDLKARDGIRAFRALTKWADVLVENFLPGSPESDDFSPQRLRRLNPRLIHVSITPFGRTGLTDSNPSVSPVELPGCHPCATASLFGAVAVLLRLKKRKITGKGSYLDLSIHESVASMLEHELGSPDTPLVPSHSEVFSILRSRDGCVQVPILRSWDTLIELIASDEKAGEFVNQDWQNPSYRGENFDRIVAAVEEWTRRRTRREIFELGQTMRFPWASVDSVEEVTQNPQLAFREFFVRTPVVEGGPAMVFPGLPFKSTAFSPGPAKPAPLAGAHTRIVMEQFYRSPKIKERASSQGHRCEDAKILEGTRVMDLTRMISGPYATRILADFGAEVTKIQSEQTAQGGEQSDTPFFSIWNRNKRSINLDLNLAAARDTFLKLVADSDVVVENFSPRVMANWGLGYERLREVNPDLVMVSISAMGQTGPWKDFVGFAPTFHALSGLLSAVSRDRNPPADIGYPYADMIAGLYAALATLSALEFRDRTGRGQHIDLSAFEAMCTFAFQPNTKHDSQFGSFDFLTDSQLKARRFFVQLNHPVLGKVLSARTPLWDWRRKPRWQPSPLFQK